MPSADVSGFRVMDVRRLQSPRGHVEIRRADGRQVRIHTKVATDHGLEVGATLSDAQLARVQAESDLREAWRTATRYLTPRQRSELEVRDRLARAGHDGGVIESTIQRLRARSLLDDRSFAHAWVESRTRRRARGREVVERELRGKGLDDELIAEAIEASYGDELDVARPLAAKYVAGLGELEWPAFRRRLGAYLSRRGFAYDAVDTLIRELWEARDARRAGASG